MGIFFILRSVAWIFAHFLRDFHFKYPKHISQTPKATPKNLLTYMGVFDLAFVSSVLPQLPADCNKWGLLWKPSVTGSYWYPFLHVRLPPAIYLSTNLYGSLWFGLCLQCSPIAPSRLQQMGSPMKALSHSIILIPFFARSTTSSYLSIY